MLRSWRHTQMQKAVAHRRVGVTPELMGWRGHQTERPSTELGLRVPGMGCRKWSGAPEGRGGARRMEPHGEMAQA